MSEPMKIIFAGTPDFAATNLEALLKTEHQVIAVYTQPDRPAGRGRKLKPSPVKELALQHDIPVYQPASLKGEPEQAELAALGADLMVVVAYGLLLPKAVLDTPRLGCINVHASLLPRWRGAAPIHRSLLAGDKETGVTIMQMDVGLDTGDMLYIKRCPINTDDTSGELHDRLAVLGAEALTECLNPLAAGEITAEPQDHDQANYAHKLEKQEGAIDWSQTGEQVYRQIRGLAPWPVAFCQLGDQVMRIWQAAPGTGLTAAPGSIIAADKKGIEIACGEGSVVLKKIQLPGGKAMDAAAALNARKEQFAIGTILD